jgi:hypothetical protein
MITTQLPQPRRIGSRSSLSAVKVIEQRLQEELLLFEL